MRRRLLPLPRRSAARRAVAVAEAGYATSLDLAGDERVRDARLALARARDRIGRPRGGRLGS